MKRILLIGNGFDLHHGMKTSYKNFFDDYWGKQIDSFKSVVQGSSVVNDDYKINYIPSNYINGRTYKDLLDGIANSNVKVQLEFINKFLERISYKQTTENWVDIEKEYYKTLCSHYNLKRQGNFKGTKELNVEFERIKTLLKNFLTEEEARFNNQDFKKIVRIKSRLNEQLFSKINIEEQSEEFKQSEYYRELKRFKFRSGKNFAEEYVFLSFNYTDNALLYSSRDNKPVKENVLETSLIKIHGCLYDDKNPMIFGYGDELDENYLNIENLDDNEFLENVKSIRYSDTSSYKKLLNTIYSGPYEVFVLGHSCGVSDRTLLNILFEHDNCTSIKVFYRKFEDNSDNFSEIIKNISRNFKDKLKMRDRVVNKENSYVF